MDAPYDPKDHEYPKHRHHLTEKTIEVQDPDEEADKTPSSDGWVDDIADLKTEKH